MKKIPMLWLFFAFSSGLWASDMALNEIVRHYQQQFKAPAITAALAEDGVIKWSTAYGVSQLETYKLATTNDVYRIASVSKPITATLILKLVDEGLINLDGGIHDYLPSYPSDKGKKDITIRHLLSHTSGIRHYAYELGEKENTAPFLTIESGLSLYGIDQEELKFVPGTDYLYSTFGYNILGAIVEKITKISFEEALKKYILKPAMMACTYLDRFEAIIPGRVGQYRLKEVSYSNAPYIDSSYKWSAGGLLSTVGDLLKFQHALFNDVLIAKETRLLAETAIAFKSGKTVEYGLGFRVFSHNNRDYIAHGGSATGGRSYILRLKNSDIAVAVLTNIEKQDDEMRQLALKLMEQWLSFN